jgi:hypothetical protein
MSWPKKPPENERCEAHTESGIDSFGAPIVMRCQEKAVETVISTTMKLEWWTCNGHAEYWEKEGYVTRNPRRQ